MGFRFRKSINLPGGFRVNASKSGIGYSWGVKGYRVSKTAKGTTRTTMSIPGTGLSYTEETSGEEPAENRTGCGCLIKIIAIPVAIIIVFILGLLVFKEPDQTEVDPPPQASYSNQPKISAPPKKENSEIASEILSEYVEFEMLDFHRTNMGYEMTIEIPGISDRDSQDNAPENWDSTQKSLTSAVSEIRNAFNAENGIVCILLVDSSENLMLKVQNGKVLDDKYYIEPTPDPSITSKPNSSGSSVLVWVSGSGKKYHSTSTCSGMTSPRAIPLSEALAKGYTACKTCH